MTWAALIPVIAGYLASLWIIVQSINKRIDSLEVRVGSVETRLGGVEANMATLLERTATIISKLDQHDAELRDRRAGS